MPDGGLCGLCGPWSPDAGPYQQRVVGSGEARVKQVKSRGKVAKMADVAKLAGVTIMTVSRALHNPSAVSAATLEKVQDAIRETGFVPNYAARSLVSQHSPIIVALFPTMMNSVFSGTIEELSRQFSAQGYNLLLGETSFDVDVEEKLLSGFMGWRPAAMILTGSEHTAVSRKILENSAAPVVELWNLPKKPFDLAVGLSNRQAAYDMTRSLHDWGYRRIAFMNLHYPNNDRSVDRSAGYRQAMAELGLEVTPEMEIKVPFGMEAGSAAVRDLIKVSPKIDAVFCASDALAVGAIMGAMRAGLKVPDDLAIAGFGNVELASTVVPSLTTVDVPRAQIGRECARIIMERLRGTYDGPAVIDCGFSIIRRESA
jgi:LacI family gluconate utilization system Gnt-I transcriptional repressor